MNPSSSAGNESEKKDISILESIARRLIHFGEKEAAKGMLLALHRTSSDILQFDDLAKTFYNLKMYHEAIDSAEAACLLANTDEQRIATYKNILNVYNHANLPEKSLEIIQKLHEMGQSDEEIDMDMAYALFLLNRKDEAESILWWALDRTNNEKINGKILFNLGTYEMMKDRFLEGFAKFIYEGRKLDFWTKQTLPFELWEGEPAEGKTVILYSEAGAGDEIINVRFMKHMRERGISPIMLSERKDLNEIYNANGFPAIHSLSQLPRHLTKENPPLYTFPMALPLSLKLEYKDLWDEPYLTKLPYTFNITTLPESPFGNKEHLKVGVRWRGNPDYEQDLHRSIPLSEMIVAIKEGLTSTDYQLYSLQKDDGLDELFALNEEEAAKGRTTPLVIPLHKEMISWVETMHFLSQLDVIITSCTGVAHLALAMGKRVYLITPISAYYPWCNTWGEKTPWYGDNITILRQVEPRSWKVPLEILSNHLSGNNI